MSSRRAVAFCGAIAIVSCAQPALEINGYRAIQMTAERPAVLQLDDGALPIIRSGRARVASVRVVRRDRAFALSLRAPELRAGAWLTRTATSAIAPVVGPALLIVELRHGPLEMFRHTRAYPILWSAPPAAEAVIRAANALKAQNQLDRGRALLQRELIFGQPWPRVLAAIELARWEGTSAGAHAAYVRAASIARAAGYPSEESRCLRSAAYFSLVRRKLEEIEPLLEQADAIDHHIGRVSGIIRSDNYRGMLAKELGEYRAAAAAQERSFEAAWERGLDGDAANALKALAPLLLDQGRHREALRAIETARPYFEAQAAPRERSYFWVDAGWVRLRAIAEGAVAADYAAVERDLQRALESMRARGGELRQRANVLINWAWLEELRGDAARAQARLDEAIAVHPQEDAFADLFSLMLRGRVAAAAGDAERAAGYFDELERRARIESGGRATDYTWRAMHARALLLARGGRDEQALSMMRAALAELENVAARTALRSARAPYFSQRRQLVEDVAALHLTRGDALAAFLVLDRAKARALEALDAEARLARASPARKAAYARSVSEYHGARDRYAAACSRIGAAAEAAAIADCEALRAALAQQFDAIAAAIEPGAGDADRGEARPAIGADRALLAADRVHDRTLIFWVFGERVEVELIDRSAAIALDDSRAARLRDRHLYIVPGGHRALASLPEAIAPDGTPWAAQISMSLIPAAHYAGRPSSAGRDGALIAADSERDLNGARLEGQRVASLLPGAQLLLGAEATAERVFERWRDVQIFHFSGHGVVASSDPWSAHLALGAGGRLGVEDILVMRPATPLVVLGACDAGTPLPLSEDEQIGLAHAFLAAGSTAVVAAVRKIDDGASLRFFERFYAAGGATQPGSAFMRTVEAGAKAGDGAWSAFRLYGEPRIPGAERSAR